MFSPRKRESVRPWGRVVSKVSKVSTPGGGDNRSTHVSAGLVGNAAAFLPAALEIVETPPSPIGRAIALSLIAAFCAALAWASLGKVDMIASVQGRIIPIGRSEIVQPFETGVVRAIHVKDGHRVQAGDVLIELDPTISDAELRHLESDLVAAQLDVARPRASLLDGDPLAAFDQPAGAPAGLLTTERQLLLDQTGEQRAKLAALDRQRTQRGLFHGNVLNVSADSVDQRKPATDPGDNNKLNTDNASEPQGHDLVYAAHVSLDRTAMEIDGKDVPLSPGMAVTVEINTGAQRVISYLMSPLLRFKQEALHER